MTAHPKIESIRSLNDAFRRSFLGGKVMLTRGVAAFDPPALAELLDKIRTFHDFSEANDPHSEHDFGAIDHDGDRIFWKIDAYDKAFRFHSPDASDPTVTSRVLTVMLAEEY